VAAEVWQLEIVEAEEIVATTDAAVFAAGSRLAAVGCVGPGAEESSDLGEAVESTVVAEYHLAEYQLFASSEHEMQQQHQSQVEMLHWMTSAFASALGADFAA
jgi:hypothetical protein